MPLPDIKSAGILSGVVRFGTPHHGLLDGVLLPDGGDGVAHPSLRSYEQRDGLWITPTLKHVVPGFIAPALPSPAPGAEWLDYGIMSGMQRALYKKDIFSGATVHNYWLSSFGNQDTWRCAITGSSAAVDASGGSASVSLKLTRFGRLEKLKEPPVGEEIINLSASLAPAGQPLFAGNETDFETTALKLVTLDVSTDGQRAILAVMPSVLDYDGYSAPRGLLLLTINKTGAVLSLLKSRTDMIVSVVRGLVSGSSGGISDADFSCTAPRQLVVPAFNSNSTTTTTATNLVGAYFDADGMVEIIRCIIVTSEQRTSVYQAWTQTCQLCNGGNLTSCTVDPQTITSTITTTITETVTLEKAIGSGIIATAASNYQAISNGSHAESGGSFNNTMSVNIITTKASIGGRPHSQAESVPTINTTSAQPQNATPVYSYFAYPYYVIPQPTGSYVRRPFEFSSANFPVADVGFGGLLAHVSNGEASFFHARTGGVGWVSAVDSAIVSIHPHSGELGKKVGTWVIPPSFGWV